ncbi:hypothetical protein [Micrococcus sp.]|uniref:hypothetical protein n=1 Tax=Micrococcus sp. TaxID=1271 RepID=UPI002A9153FE|nr:hypothetical protein [Micrococcus sp.]MDY6056065.1 hypothetical protein [Micrococcus sp.]
MTTTSHNSSPDGTPPQGREDARPDAGPTPTRRARPRRALAAPGQLPPEAIARHTRLLRGEPDTPEAAARHRRDLSDLLHRLSGAAAGQTAAAEEAARRAERAAEQERRRKAAQLARRRRQELRRRRQQEAERRRREAAAQRERAAAEAERRREAERERRHHEAAVAAERARVQAERRRREEEAAEAARQARARERARIAAERAAAEAERRRIAAEAARTAAEARRRVHEAARRYPAQAAERALTLARLTEDRRREQAAQEAAEIERRWQEHRARETRALLRAARELDGPEVVPAPQDRPLLSTPEEDLSDDALLARARAALPEWRRRDRLATKAAAVQALSRRGPASSAAARRALIPGHAAEGGAADPTGPATATDRRRQLAVTGAWLLFTLSSAWGLGLFRFVPGLDALHAGTYRAAQDGRYGATTTVFSLFPTDLLVWPVLWAALAVHMVHQWRPGQGGAARQRATGLDVAGAMTALALWFPLAMLVPWGLDVVVWLMALALMLRTVRVLTAVPAGDRRTATAQDGPVGALFAVVLVGAPTVLAAVFAAWGVDLPWFPSGLVATVLLLVVLAVLLRVVLTGRGWTAPALTAAWMLLCLALPRLLPAPLGGRPSAAVGLTAAFGALALLLAVVVRRSWMREVERGAGNLSGR